MRDRLIELLKQIDFDYGEECVLASEDGYKCTPDLAEFFADKLLANGVIVPPCKVGDTVYVVSRYYTGTWEIFECKVDELTIYEKNIFIKLISVKGNFNFGYGAYSIGKSVFFTREQAEQALAGVANGT